MKERGMIFNAEMVRAILDGRKTQTRRPVQFKPRDPGLNLNSSGLELGHYRSGVPLSGCVLRSRGGMGCWNDRTYPAKCPFGQPGDRIWVREAYRFPQSLDDVSPRGVGEMAVATGYKRPWSPVFYQSTGDFSEGWNGFETPPTVSDAGRLRPSTQMPRWASRITLEITGVRVEQLQDISKADARAEGITDGGCLNCGEPEPCGCSEPKPCAVDAFAHLWQTIYGEGNWFSNPWVWVIEFREVK